MGKNNVPSDTEFNISNLSFSLKTANIFIEIENDDFNITYQNGFHKKYLTGRNCCAYLILLFEIF